MVLTVGGVLDLAEERVGRHVKVTVANDGPGEVLVRLRCSWWRRLRISVQDRERSRKELEAELVERTPVTSRVRVLRS